MKNKTKHGAEILKASIILGISGNLLIRGVEPGINVMMWVLLLSAAMVAVSFRRSRELWNPQTIILTAAILFFAAMFAFRDSLELLLLDTLAILGILAVLVLPAQKIKVHAAGLCVYFLSGIWTGIATMFLPFFVLFKMVDWGALGRGRVGGHLLSASKGLLIGLPLVLVFGGLLMSADADYQSFVMNILDFDAGDAVPSIAFTIVLSWLTLGYLNTAFSTFSWGTSDPATGKENVPVEAPRFSVTELDTEDPVPAPQKTEAEPTKKKRAFDWNRFDNSVLPKFLTFGRVETVIILGLMNLVFISFIVVQLPYLFGGMDLVQATPDFKLAEYARRGVGELIAVSLLVLPVLLAIHWLLRKEDKGNERFFKILAGVQIGLLFVIMLSAVQRLLLLTGSLGYGLTTFRFYAMFMLIFLAMVFAWFGMTVLRGARHEFAWGVLWSALFVIAALHFVNPDQFIVKTNLELMKQGRSYDAAYNSNLSADSVPALVESLQWLDHQQCEVAMSGLRNTAGRLGRRNDFRSWNWSRSQASANQRFQALSKAGIKETCRDG